MLERSERLVRNGAVYVNVFMERLEGLEGIFCCISTPSFT